MAMMVTDHSLDKLHEMLEFGTVHGATQEVRINRLEDRLYPLVPFPHRHDFYHLVVVTEGKGWHEIDFRRSKVGAFQVYFMKPGQVHSWMLHPKTRGFVVEFGGAALFEKSYDQLPDHIDFSDVSKSSQDSLLGLLELMLDEYEKRRGDFETSLRHFLVPLLIELSRASSNQSSAKFSSNSAGIASNSDPILQRFVQLVEEFFKSEHSVTFYAHHMKTTPKAITMRVTRGLGKSARAVIQDRVLLEIKRLLAYSDLSIAQIAYALGFEDPNYFARFFKKATGLSPMAFREKARSP
jgi:AraC family transcriptional regulator, transcriptional activator of pobA